MLSDHTSVAATDDLLRAARPVKHSNRDGDFEMLPVELGVLAEALRVARRACDRSASRMVPAAETLDRGICSRYQRAAAGWPASPPPSYERFAAALASLHEAADGARLAARSCDQARQAVEVLLQPSRRS